MHHTKSLTANNVLLMKITGKKSLQAASFSQSDVGCMVNALSIPAMLGVSLNAAIAGVSALSSVLAHDATIMHVRHRMTKSAASKMRRNFFLAGFDHGLFPPNRQRIKHNKRGTEA